MHDNLRRSHQSIDEVQFIDEAFRGVPREFRESVVETRREDADAFDETLDAVAVVVS